MIYFTTPLCITPCGPFHDISRYRATTSGARRQKRLALHGRCFQTKTLVLLSWLAVKTELALLTCAPGGRGHDYLTIVVGSITHLSHLHITYGRIGPFRGYVC